MSNICLPYHTEKDICGCHTFKPPPLVSQFSSGIYIQHQLPVLFCGPELHEQLFVKVVYSPTTNVPKIDINKTITMKTTSNIPLTILLNIITSIHITIVIKKILGLLNRIKQDPISLNCDSILFSGDFYRCVSMILVTVLIIRI